LHALGEDDGTQLVNFLTWLEPRFAKGKS
jgi:hypothetical protein